MIGDYLLCGFVVLCVVMFVCVSYVLACHNDNPRPMPKPLHRVPPPRRVPQTQPVPDAEHEPHWIDPALNFYGVEVKGRDQ